MDKNKFRGIRLDNNEWVEGYYVKHINATPPPICSEYEYEQFVDQHTEHHIFQDGFSDWCLPRDTVHFQVKGETIGQFTGLQDKNHKDIYEGDILSLNDMLKLVKCITHPVVGILSGLYLEHISGYNGTPMVEDCEIIGNIYNNPELLEN